jgi:hypothetical protein
MENRVPKTFNPSDYNLGEVHEFLLKFGQAGLDPEMLQPLIENLEMAKFVVTDLAYVEKHWPTTPVATAHNIMGPNRVFSLMIAQKYFGLEVAEAEFKKNARVPFSVETLRRCANTHLLVCVPGGSLGTITANLPTELINSSGHRNQDLWSKRSWSSWQLIRATLLPELFGLRSEHQSQEMPWDEDHAQIRDVVYTALVYSLVTGRRLFGNVAVKCEQGWILHRPKQPLLINDFFGQVPKLNAATCVKECRPLTPRGQREP